MSRALELLTKPTLVSVSHAVEQAALASADDGPLAVVALFQRVPYLERARAAYERIAQAAAVTVVAVVGDPAASVPMGAVPAGAVPVALAPDEPSAREWSVVVLTPQFGASLVAFDREEARSDEVTLEAGRLFDARWGFRRDDARAELARLTVALGDRLPPPARATIGAVLERAGATPAPAGEVRAEASARLFAARMDRQRSSRRALVARLDAHAAGGLDRDSETGLPNVRYLRRWVGEGGVTASGTLPLTLAAVAVDGLRDLTERYGLRGADAAIRAVVEALTRSRAPGDRVVRLGEDRFLLVLPGRHPDAVVAAARGIVDGLSAAGRQYPFLPLTTTVVTTVTRRRPLPLAELEAGLAWARAAGVPVAALPGDGIGEGPASIRGGAQSGAPEATAQGGTVTGTPGGAPTGTPAGVPGDALPPGAALPSGATSEPADGGSASPHPDAAGRRHAGVA